jgi:SAM-dependent methyltransferase
MPFRDGAFAAVVSLDVLSHAAVDPPRALAEMRRVLAPGGRLVLNLPAFGWLRSAHDARVHNSRRFVPTEARRMLDAAGFQTVALRFWNALLLPLMVVQRKILARAPDKGSDVATFPPWLDRTLHATTAVERRLMRAGLRFPAGGSLHAIATRP